MDNVLRDAERGIERAVRNTFSEHLDKVADTARANHVFRNRTGRLEGSITAGDVTGSVERGRLEGSVDATQDYASFVIGKTGDNFLLNAANAMTPELEQGITRAVTAALQDALDAGAGDLDGI